MHILTQVFGSAAATLAFYGLYHLVKFQIFSSIRNLPGPESPSWIHGNFEEIMTQEDAVLYQRWIKQYGRTFRCHGLLGEIILVTLDTKALSHILMDNHIYQKPESDRYQSNRIVGRGLLVAEGNTHKLQRKVINPAFGLSQIRDMTETFIKKSVQANIWMTQVAAGGGTARINVLKWLSRMTLDVIGLSGFNYNFNGLSEDSGHASELNDACDDVFGNPELITSWFVLQGMIPALRILPSDISSLEKARQRMDLFGKKLLRDSKAALEASGEKRGELESRDLLSLLVRSNMRGDSRQQMSDEEVVAQVSTFIIAGLETTSTGTTWALLALVEYPDIQQKLRDELYTMDTENPTMEELNSLPYLDAVIKETLRFHAPVPGVRRVATQNDVIPLGEPMVDKNGVIQTSISVQKGQIIDINIHALNRDKGLWGEDAMDFKPERWENLPETVSSIPGVWGNMLTFLGGPRACIGYRFSLIEMKALLFVLVRGFELELGCAREDLTKKTVIVQRPRLKSEPDRGSQLPLLIRAYQRGQ